jgi:hypothetical protein
VAVCAVAILGGFIGGRVTASGSVRTKTVEQTVERSVVVLAHHVRSARDGRDAGPMDLVYVDAVRRGAMLQTTIVARRPWRDSLLRGGHVRISILYDTNDDGTPDRRDIMFLFRGRPTSWISSLGQGVQAADVTRPSATTISVTRDAHVFYNGAGQAQSLWTSAIGVAVVARWKGGFDRVPDRGWIAVPPPQHQPTGLTP